MAIVISIVGGVAIVFIGVWLFKSLSVLSNVATTANVATNAVHIKDAVQIKHGKHGP